MKKIFTLLYAFKAFAFLGLALLPSLVWSQNYQSFDASTTNAWTDSKWSTSSSTNACVSSGLSNAFTTGRIAYFCTVNGTGSGAVGISVGGIIATENYTHSSASGTLLTGGTVVTVDVSAGKIFNIGLVPISTAAGTGFIKANSGAYQTRGGTFTGGFTVNAGTMLLASVNAMGAGGALTLNGGTVAGTATLDLTGKYTGGITIGGDVQFGEMSTVVTGANSTANLTFSNNMALGGSLRIFTLGNGGNMALGGVISNSGSNGITFAANANGTGKFVLTGANSYSGTTTLTGGTLQLNRAGGNTIPTTNSVSVTGGTLQVSTNQTLNNLTLSSGSVTVDNGVNLTIDGALTLTAGTITLNGGTLTIGSTATISRTNGNINASAANATVIFTNTSALSLPASTFTGNVTNLTMNGAGGISINDGVTLTVTGTLTLTSGKITLGTGNVIAAAFSGGSSSSYVVTEGTGKLTINAVSTATFPVGPTTSAYNPVTISAGKGSNYAVNVTTTAPTGTGVSSNAAISRQWDITPSGTPSAVSLTLHYNDNEGVLGSFNPTGSMDGIHFNGTKWNYIGTAMGVVNMPYSVTFTYAGPTWSPFSFGNSGVLPTELTNLKAKTQNGQNLITWQTATEKNSNRFDIQRSTNPQANWQTIGTVKAAGSSQTTKNYQFTDDAPLSISYYRLRSVDFDGKESLSNIVSVISDKGGKLKVYPTIAQDKVTISSDSNEPQTFNIYNLLGQNIQTGQLIGQKDLNINTLSTGTYFLKVNGETVRFVKN